MSITAADVKVKFSTEGDKKVTDSLDRVGDKTKSLSDKFKGIGLGLTAGVTAPVLGFFTKAFQGASSLEQAIGKTNAVFGDSSGIILDWSKTSSDAFGLSRAEALAATGTYGQLFQTFGNGREESVKLSQNMISLAADVGAFNDISTERANSALTSALVGEYDALQRYGIILTGAMVDQEAMNIAVKDGRDTVTEADKAQARYNLIMKQAGPILGQFERESTGAAGSLAIFQAHMKDLTGELGAVLLPIGTKVIRMLTDWVRAVQNLSPGMQKLVVIVAAAAAAIGPLLIGMALLVHSFGIVKGAIISLKIAALFTNPIGLAIVAIAALAAGAIYAYTHFEPFRNAVNATADALMRFVVSPVVDFIQSMVSGVQTLISAFQGLRELGLSPIDAALLIISQLFETLAEKAGAFGNAVRVVGDIITTGIRAWSELIKGIIDLFQGDFSDAWDHFGEAAKLVLENILNLFVGLPTAVIDAFSQIPWGQIGGILVDGAQAAWNALLNAVGALAGTLAIKGYQLITSLDDRFDEAWGVVSEWLGDIKQLVLAAVPATWNWLLDKGSDLIGSIKTGFGLAWLLVQDWLGNVKDWVLGYFDWADATFLLNIGNAIFTGFKDGLSAGWDKVTAFIEPAIDGFVTTINKLIGAYNAIPGLPDIEKIGDLGADAEAATPKVDALTNSLLGLNAELAGLGAAKLGNSLALGGGGDSGGGGGKDEASDDTVAFNTAARKAGFATSQLAQRLSSLFQGALTAVTGFKEQIAAIMADMTQKASEEFNKLPFMANTSMTQMATLAGMAASTMAAQFGGTLGSMLADTQTQFTGIRQTGTSETQTLQSSVLANAGSMLAGWASRLTTMTGDTRSRFADMRRTGASETNNLQSSALSNAASMAGGWAARLADMAGSTGRQFGNIRSTGTAETNSLSANVGSNLGSMASNSAVRIAGMQAGLALKFLAMKASAVGSSQDMAAQVVAVHASMGVQAALAAGRGLSTIPGIVRSVGSAAASVGYSAGANISRGFANGMYAYLGSIRAAANAMVSAAYAAVRARALIASPSRLFAGLGEQMGEGLAVGMEAKRERLARVARDITAMLAGITQTGVRDLTSSLDTVMSQPIMNRQGQRIIPELSVNNSGMGGTTVHNHNYYSVTPDDLKNLIDNAEAGGEFARDFGGGIAKRRGSL